MMIDIKRDFLQIEVRTFAETLPRSGSRPTLLPSAEMKLVEISWPGLSSCLHLTTCTKKMPSGGKFYGQMRLRCLATVIMDGRNAVQNADGSKTC